MTSDDISREQAEQVLAALGRIRGRRGPRPGGRRDPRSTPWGPGLHPGDHDAHAHAHDHAHAPGAEHDPFAADRGRPGEQRAARGRQDGPDWFGGRLGGPARLRLLEALAAASSSLSVSEVAAAVGVDQPRASRLIQQAADLDLVVREPDPDDARRTRVRLTPAGKKFAQGSRGHRHDLIGTALGTMSDADRAEFVRLLTQFAAAWPED